jgi:hypothetical protein
MPILTPHDEIGSYCDAVRHCFHYVLGIHICFLWGRRFPAREFPNAHPSMMDSSMMDFSLGVPPSPIDPAEGCDRGGGIGGCSHVAVLGEVKS